MSHNIIFIKINITVFAANKRPKFLYIPAMQQAKHGYFHSLETRLFSSFLVRLFFSGATFSSGATFFCWRDFFSPARLFSSGATFSCGRDFFLGKYFMYPFRTSSFSLIFQHFGVINGKGQVTILQNFDLNFTLPPYEPDPTIRLF